MNQKQQIRKNSKEMLKENTNISIIIKGLSIALLLTIVISVQFFKDKQQNKNNKISVQIITRYALLGDVGGTNVRLQIVEFVDDSNKPLRIIKQQRMKVKNYDTFQQCIHQFLSNITNLHYPEVAVIAMAGPIDKNSILLSNVPKWGKLIGQDLAKKFDIPQFKLINDFQAASYGLSIVQDSEFVKLNNKTIDKTKIRGVIGPGTGLGHSIIFNNGLSQSGYIVLPSQAGHADVPLIDEQTIQYFNFLKQRTNANYITLQKSFCGPSIPFMLQFYMKDSKDKSALGQLASEQIVQQCLKEDSDPIFQRTFQLFMKFYSSAVANFMIQHMTMGGIYLVGGLTKSLLPKILKIDILKVWKDRHPEMKSVVEQIPIVFCKQVDLGLRGAFVIAKQLSKKNKTKIKSNQDIF